MKLKEVYQNLRDEHIKLLRHKAEIDKKFSVTNMALEQSQKIQCELQDSLQLSKASIKETENELNVLKTMDAAKIQQLDNEKVALQEINSQLNVICSLFEEWKRIKSYIEIFFRRRCQPLSKKLQRPKICFQNFGNKIISS